MKCYCRNLLLLILIKYRHAYCIISISYQPVSCKDCRGVFLFLFNGEKNNLFSIRALLWESALAWHSDRTPRIFVAETEHGHFFTYRPWLALNSVLNTVELGPFNSLKLCCQCDDWQLTQGEALSTRLSHLICLCNWLKKLIIPWCWHYRQVSEYPLPLTWTLVKLVECGVRCLRAASATLHRTPNKRFNTPSNNPQPSYNTYL